EIVDHSDVSLYVMTPEYGAASQLEKIDMLDFADIIAINKFDKRGALDPLRDVRKQYFRNHDRWGEDPDTMPVFGTIASQFNDPGTNTLYRRLMDIIVERTQADLKSSFGAQDEMSEKIFIIPPSRVRYLAEIAENNRNYDKEANAQAQWARKWFQLVGSLEMMKESGASEPVTEELERQIADVRRKLNIGTVELLENWKSKREAYRAESYTYYVRNKPIELETHTLSLSRTRIPKVILPKFEDWGEIVRWSMQENVPGEFPYTAGVFPFKRKGEDPTRMFAGEGSPERTNRRFHYLSLDMPANRLSTAFDSVTL